MVPEYLKMKRRYFPGLIPPESAFLDAVRPEIKGADIRRSIASGSHKPARHAERFLSAVVDLCIQANVRLVSKVYVKGVGRQNRHTSIYTAACQALFISFDHYLSSVEDVGFCIADSRTKGLNVPVAHSIFTQKFSARQNYYPRILELPTFGHSENHVGVQICDLLASAIIIPAVTHEYCTGHVANVHVQPGYSRIRDRFTPQLQQMLYRYQDDGRKWRGGITVSDAILHRPSSALFQNIPTE